MLWQRMTQWQLRFTPTLVHAAGAHGGPHGEAVPRAAKPSEPSAEGKPEWWARRDDCGTVRLRVHDERKKDRKNERKKESTNKERKV